MPNIVEITSLAAPELDVYARLTEAQRKNRRHPEQGLFIAESLTVISHALFSGCKPVSFLMERKQIQGQAAPLLEQYPEIPVYTAEREVLKDLTGYALTRGVLCAMRRPMPKSLEEICKDARRIAVLENIVDPTNVGAIFRSAAALGVDAVLVNPSCCDPLSRRAVRVSMGTVFQIPWTFLGETAADWPEKGMRQLREMGFHTAAMALREDSVTIGDEKLRRNEKLAILLGTEGTGLLPKTIEMSDDTVMIPMDHGVDSLNVAAASAVAFYALCKER